MAGRRDLEVLLAGLAAVATLAGCGAKTGLAERTDAGPDADPDADPDAARDADPGDADSADVEPWDAPPEGCLTGETAGEWEMVPAGARRGLMAWVPPGQRAIYAGSGGTFARLDLDASAWTDLPAPPESLAAWGSPALAHGAVWEIRPPFVVRFDVGAGSWSTPVASVAGRDDEAMTVTDRQDRLWSFAAEGRLVRYDPASGEVAVFPTGISTNSFETRLGYDGPSDSIFFGGFAAPDLYRFDVATGAVTSRATHPEAALNDIFCADRCGHVYAAGGNDGDRTMWQYDVGTDRWSRIPDLPESHGINGSCAVLADGWLYVEHVVGNPRALYRLRLL